MSIRNCSSPASLKAEFEVVRRLQQKGASWNQLEQGIVRLTACSNNGGCAFETEMVAGIRSLSTPLNNAISSERSRLSAAAIELVSSLSAGLGPAFEPLIPLFFPTLLRLCARTNTVFTRRAKACIFNVIENTQSPLLLSYLTEYVNHKSTSLRLVAAKGVLACLNFKPLNDTRAHLIEGVIKSTSQDARADVRKAGENILQAYKALLPDGAESFIGLSPVTKKPSAVQGTAASRSTSRVSSRRHPTTGRVGPVGSLCAEKISSGTHAEQSHPVSSAKLQREIFAVRPATSVRKDAASEAGQSSVQNTKPTTQRPQRVGNNGTVAPRETAQVLSRGRPTIGGVSPVQGPSSMQSAHRRRDITRPSVPTSKLPQRAGIVHTRPRGEEPKVTPSLPETDETNLARTRVRKTRPLSVKPNAVDPLPKSPMSDNSIPTEAQLQTVSSQASQGTSARHGMFRPSKPSMQSTSQQVASPLVPANKPLQQVQSKVVRSHSEVPRVGTATRRVTVRPAPLPQTDMARTRVRKTRPLSVKPSVVDPLPNLPISKCDLKSNPILMEVDLRTKTSQASRRRVIESQASKQVVGQKKVSVRGGRPVTTVSKPKPVLNELIDAIIAVINNPDTINPPRSRDCVREPPVQIPSHMLVPQDVKLPSHMSMGCRIRRPSWRPPHEDSRCGASFFISSLRASVASPLSPLRIHGAEAIPHVHNPDISCFQGCELQEVLDRFNLDIELDHATMLYR